MQACNIKARLLPKRKLQYLLARLRTLDMEIMRAFVVKRVNEKEAIQLSHYQSRQALWAIWNSSAKLDTLLQFLLDGFMNLFKKHTTGAERFARFLAAWYNFVGSLACSAISNERTKAVWLELTAEYPSQICDEDRSAVVFAVATSAYTFLQQQVSLLQSAWTTTQLEAVREDSDVEPDDDTSLYRLFGFALFAGIRYRKRVVYGKLRRRATGERRMDYQRHLKILKSLVEIDKSVLPACIALQDRGKMTFPERTFLPFARNCSREIKKLLNPSKYKLYRRKIMQVTKQEVVSNDDLFLEFKMFVAYHQREVVSERDARLLFKEIITRVVNTMSNSFLNCQEVMRRIAEKKGVDAQMSLRDKLKAYAGETHAKLTL